MSDQPPRVDVLGSRISICDKQAALATVERCIANGGGGYVCFTNAHTTVMGRRDSTFRAVTNGSLLSVADGKAVYWVAHNRTTAPIGHVPGPDFFLYALSQRPRRRHFLYGSTSETLEALRYSLEKQIPGLKFCGVFSPPFRPLTEVDMVEHVRMIQNSGAEFVWVGLGAPKQERWMADCGKVLAPAVLFGVGAAFDFYSGKVKRAPRVMRLLGLEWLHRLYQEPRRLWKRYLITNSLFFCFLVKDLLTGRPARTGRRDNG